MLYNERLTNGIRFVGQHLPHFRSVSVGIWIKTGSVNETIEINGISHFIEHMLFKGTKKRSAKQIAMEMDSIGGQINAFTSKESTCYYASVMDKHLPDALEMLSDIVLNSVLDPEEMEKEKGVIMEEISMVEDSPEDLVHELLAKAFFKDDRFGMSILGPEDNIRFFTRQNLLDYMRERYTSDNIIISIAGNFDKDNIQNMLEKYLCCVPQKAESTLIKKTEFSPGERSLQLKKKETEQINICLAMPGMEYGSDDLYAMMIMNNLFGGGMSSRLFQKIREEKGMAYSVYSYPSAYSRAGMFTIYAGTKPKNALEVITMLMEEIKLIRNGGIDNSEFLRSKEQLKGNYILGSESASSRMMACGKSMSLLDKVQSIEEVLALIEDVNIDQVNAIIPNIFNISKMSASFVGNIKEKDLEAALEL